MPEKSTSVTVKQQVEALVAQSKKLRNEAAKMTQQAEALKESIERDGKSRCREQEQ